jgi:hypothetical protein
VNICNTCGDPKSCGYDDENSIEDCEDRGESGVFISCELVCSYDGDNTQTMLSGVMMRDMIVKRMLTWM